MRFITIHERLEMIYNHLCMDINMVMIMTIEEFYHGDRFQL